jgi:hypothetical protein
MRGLGNDGPVPRDAGAGEMIKLRQVGRSGFPHLTRKARRIWGTQGLPFVWVGLLMLCAGCHSRFVEVTIVNEGSALHVMEFDYPNASFGANLLDSGAKYHYRFKIQGSGPVSLQYQDAAGQSHTSEGPKVGVGEEGSLLVNIDARGAVTWTPTLTNRR